MWFILLALALAGIGAYYYFHQPSIIHGMSSFWELAGVGVLIMFILLGVSFLVRKGPTRRGSLKLFLLILFLSIFISFSLGSTATAAVAKEYRVTIVWHDYKMISEYNTLICKYNRTHNVYLHGSMGLIHTIPRFSFSLGYPDEHYNKYVDLTGLLVSLDNHTRMVNPDKWVTSFTIVVKNDGYYVDGVKICSSSINLDFKPDPRVHYNITTVYVVHHENQIKKVVENHPMAIGLGLGTLLLSLLLMRRV